MNYFLNTNLILIIAFPSNLNFIDGMYIIFLKIYTYKFEFLQIFYKFKLICMYTNTN